MRMKLTNISLAGLTAALQPAMERFRVPGAAAAFIRDGEILPPLCLGSAGDGRPVSTGTHFEAASLTKPAFAYTVFKLCDKGLISLDEPIWTYSHDAPSEDERIRSLTPRHVLMHASGLPNWDPEPHSLAFAPGEGFGYSGEGYTYLQRAVEAVCKARLDVVMQRELFSPLHMDDCALIWTGALRRTLARSYDGEGNIEPRRETAEHTTTTEPNAAYSLYTTIEDYPKFLQALIADKWAARFKGSLNPTPCDGRWGLGWGVSGNALWHWGDNGGYKSFVVWDDSTGDAALMHTNGQNGLNVCFEFIRRATDFDTSRIEAYINTVD